MYTYSSHIRHMPFQRIIENNLDEVMSIIGDLLGWFPKE